MATQLILQPRICRECNTTVLSGEWRERCLQCGKPYADVAVLEQPRESTPYDCPVCEESPRSCTCLRPSVRRRIANAIGAAKV
ncbi:MAG: hypothetical protein ABR599_01660 [Gemmatimonadota bacterium]